MLPYALKVVWFSLSLSGLVLCWIVLTAFEVSVDALWLPMTYCAAVTVLEGNFLLGIIWRMDPFLMPKGFCTVQVVLTAFSAFVLTGVCATFTMAMVMCVLWPGDWLNSERATLAWRRVYAFPLILFPILASAAHITVIIKLDAVQPTDDLICDASDPLWVRFLGFAGPPLLVAIPCFVLSIVSAIKVFRTHKQIQRSQRHEVNFYVDNLTSVPLLTPYSNKSLNKTRSEAELNAPFRADTSSPLASSSSLPRNESPGRARASPLLLGRRFHLPFEPTPSELNDSSIPSSQYEQTPDNSPSAPYFPSMLGHNKESPRPYRAFDLPGGSDHLRSFDGGRDGNEDTISDASSMLWAAKFRNSEHWWAPQESLSFLNSGDVDSSSGRGRRRESNHLRQGTVDHGFPAQFEPRLSQADLTPAIRRLLIFHAVFLVTILLASTSTIIDIANHRPKPTPFGTHHVALLLAVWGPVFVFGHLPDVRHTLGQWSKASRPQSSPSFLQNP